MTIHLLSCVFGTRTIPQRYVTIVLIHLGLINAYHLRVVLNVAMVEMQMPKNHSSKVDACPMFEPQDIPMKEGKFQWPNDTEAFILYAFYIGYMFSHVPGGWLADRFGSKPVMGFCMLMSIITNLLYPLAIKLTDYYGAIILRIVLGIAQGPMLPTVSTFIQCWVPESERSILGAIAFSGSNLGAVSGSLLTGIMIRTSKNWTTPFYVWGCTALVWYIVYHFWVYSRPSEHPFITKEEALFLKTRTEERKSFKPPWLELAKSVPIWALLFGQYAHNIIFFGLFTNLPKYMKEILKLSMTMNSTFYAISFLLLWVLGFVFAYLAEVMEFKFLLSLLFIRRFYTFISCFIPAVLIIAVPYSGCNRAAVLTLQTLAIGLLAPFFSGMKVNVNDITNHYGGVVMGIVNGLGASAGIIGPYLVGALTKDESLEEWKTYYYIIGAMTLFGAVIYVIFAQAERQPWDFLDDPDTSANIQD